MRKLWTDRAWDEGGRFKRLAVLFLFIINSCNKSKKLI